MSNEFSFSLAKPLSKNLLCHNVSDVQGPLFWINDFATTRSILTDLEPDPREIEFDKKCHAREEELFFFDMMSFFRWKLLNQRQYGWYAACFNTGLIFDIEKCNRAQDFFLLCLKRKNLYTHGALFKRFKHNTEGFIFLFENGECYVTARNKTHALWMCGVMNYNLQQIFHPNDLRMLPAAEKKPEGKMLLRTKEIREKKLDHQLRSDSRSENKPLFKLRVQPDRAAKSK